MGRLARTAWGASLCLLGLGPAGGVRLAVNPIAQTLELIKKLEATITRDGEAEQAAYDSYFVWCTNASSERAYEIKVASREKARLQAEIQEADSTIEASNNKIEQLSQQILQVGEKLKQATALRTRERADFQASEQELVDSIDMLDRALRVLERQAQQGASAFMQSKAKAQGLHKVLAGLQAVVEAAGLPAADGEKLAALLQSRDDAEEGDEEPGAPSAQAYSAHSGGIVEVMEDLRDKAEAQLRESRSAEAAAQHDYELVRQALTNEDANANKALQEERATKASSEEAKAAFQGDLAVASRQLEESTQALKHVQQSCMQTASDHEATVKGRKEELKALADAKSVIASTMRGAGARTYSLVQLASSSSPFKPRPASKRSLMQLEGKKVVSMVKRLADEQRSTALAQLVSRLATVFRYAETNGEDPFAKVKKLISDMIARLEKEQTAEQQQKAYCDSEMNKTSERKGELEDRAEALKVKIDQLVAASVGLKGQVQTLGEEMAELKAEQLQVMRARTAEHEAYLAERADLQQGLEGTRSAIRILRNYYAADAAGPALLQGSLVAEMQQPTAPALHESSSGAGAGIIGLLEVVESDIAKNLAQVETEEDGAQAEFETLSQENKVLATKKAKDVEYKTRERKGIDKTVSDLSSDAETTGSELDAVSEYYEKLKQQCVAKPEGYEARMARRRAEIRGLEEALALLQGEGALLQQRLD